MLRTKIVNKISESRITRWIQVRRERKREKSVSNNNNNGIGNKKIGKMGMGHSTFGGGRW